MNIYYIFSGLSILLSIFIFVLYIKYHSAFDDYINGIDKKEYLLPNLFYIGFGCISMFHLNTNSKRANERTKVIAELKGSTYAQFYYFVNLAGQITYGVLCVFFALLVTAYSRDYTMSGLFLLVGLVLILYLDYDIDSRLKKKKETMMLEFPHVLSKMALLVNAGMPVRETFPKVVENQEGIVYDEIRVMIDELNNGESEHVALKNLAERCGISEIRKFTSMLSQNIQKGSSDIAKGLIEMNDEIWRGRTSHVRELGEKASAKLLIPIIIILIGILMMILVPVFANIS